MSTNNVDETDSSAIASSFSHAWLLELRSTGGGSEILTGEGVALLWFRKETKRAERGQSVRILGRWVNARAEKARKGSRMDAHSWPNRSWIWVIGDSCSIDVPCNKPFLILHTLIGDGHGKFRFLMSETIHRVLLPLVPHSISFGICCFLFYGDTRIAWLWSRHKDSRPLFQGLRCRCLELYLVTIARWRWIGQ